MAWTSQKLLMAIYQAGSDDCVTEQVLAESTGLNAGQVARAMCVLRRHKLIDKVGPGCHRLTAEGRRAAEHGMRLTSGPKGRHTGVRKPRPGRTLRERAWAAMRILRKFTQDDLILRIAQGQERDIESNVGKYTRALVKAGILTELPRREPGTALTSNGYKRYWLSEENDTGPRAPIWRPARGQVYDPNTERQIDLGGRHAVA